MRMLGVNIGNQLTSEDGAEWMIGRLAADGMLRGQRQDIKWKPDWG